MPTFSFPAAMLPQALVQFAPDTHNIVPIDPASNDARPQTALAGKSRRMRPTKSVTARYVYSSCSIPLLSLILSSMQQPLCH